MNVRVVWEWPTAGVMDLIISSSSLGSWKSIRMTRSSISNQRRAEWRILSKVGFPSGFGTVAAAYSGCRIEGCACGYAKERYAPPQENRDGLTGAPTDGGWEEYSKQSDERRVGTGDVLDFHLGFPVYIEWIRTREADPQVEESRVEGFVGGGIDDESREETTQVESVYDVWTGWYLCKDIEEEFGNKITFMGYKTAQLDR
ncbi:hypothetical protein IW261DRAFT_1424548 [Armillaria novae-zelandiae]|uniref:Uncharacterized protein n=1 Tax=Armillaria novae-zelandiae TaxID=153914 RepID=A0AA39NUK6_9AGAR|nr:hypothetical protein IW261DRAFT_1424548 [Armillaria novae-zelandiae]